MMDECVKVVFPETAAAAAVLDNLLTGRDSNHNFSKI
jgi:hypothetical protein